MYVLTLRRTFKEVFTFVQNTFLFLIRRTNAEKDVIPVDLFRNVYDLALEPKKIGVYDCSHTDFYNKERGLLFQLMKQLTGSKNT